MKVHTVNADGSTGTSGEMDFLLLDQYAPNNIAHITELANSTPSELANAPAGAMFYDGLTFHRIISNFMDQGGDPKGDGTGGSNTIKVDDELSADLRFDSTGLLALANGGNDTNDCQFFIMNAAYDSLDFGYTIIGDLVAGDNIRQAIANVPVKNNSQGEDSQPLNPPIIDSVRVVANTAGMAW